MILDGDLFHVQQYMRELADRMQLKDWIVTVMAEQPNEDDSAASCKVTYGHKSAQIRFSATWATWSNEYFREVCVHELLHCHFQPIEWNLYSAQTPLGLAAFTILEGGFRDTTEICVQ